MMTLVGLIDSAKRHSLTYNITTPSTSPTKIPPFNTTPNNPDILFILNFLYSVFKGRKAPDANPWKSNTLEWTTDILPGHGNWKGEIPTVYRWPYDYSKNGDEFIPQTEPYRPGEEKLHH